MVLAGVERVSYVYPCRGSLSPSLVGDICPSGGNYVRGVMIPPCQRGFGRYRSTADTTAGGAAGEESQTLCIRHEEPYHAVQIVLGAMAFSSTLSSLFLCE